MSSSLVCETGGEEDEKIITVGSSRAISAASCSGPLGMAVSLPPDSTTAWRASAISRSSKGIGGIDQMYRSSTSQPWSAAALLARLARLGEHRGQRVGVEVALVEQHLGAARDGRHDARLAGRAADRADALVADADLA